MHRCDWKGLSGLKEDGGMGFRNLSLFNIALLAKQGWRILRSPNSLLARTLTAKYYKESDFLNSRLGNLPPFTWQGIWAAKGLLWKGLGWRIGDGQQVSILEDVWVPELEEVRIQSPIFNEGLIKVADLIDTVTRRWNAELIYNNFPVRVLLSVF